MAPLVPIIATRARRPLKPLKNRSKSSVAAPDAIYYVDVLVFFPRATPKAPFYSQIFRQPAVVGRHVIRYCDSVVPGTGYQDSGRAGKNLNIKPGQTIFDGRFTPSCRDLPPVNSR